jgi:hypothetical protein
MHPTKDGGQQKALPGFQVNPLSRKRPLDVWQSLNEPADASSKTLFSFIEKNVRKLWRTHPP